MSGKSVFRTARPDAPTHDVGARARATRKRWTPAELEAAATAIIEAAGPKRRRSRDTGPAVEWSLSPICAEDYGDDDAGEIAAMFAELSGGRLVPSMVACMTDEHAAGVVRRREYMREARRDPETRARWRTAERERRRRRTEAARAESRLESAA